MSDYCDISEQLLFYEVLTRLPVKSLLRFRCVSKSWRATIDSPIFIKLQYDQRQKVVDPSDVTIVVSGFHYRLTLSMAGHRSTNPKTRTKRPSHSYRGTFHLRSAAPPVVDLVNVDDYDSIEPSFIGGDKRLSLKEIHRGIQMCKGANPGSDTKVVGSCSGLVCVRLDYLASPHTYTFVFYNPLTQKHWDLPLFNRYSDAEFQPSSCGCGFGLDCVSDDLKLVVLAEYGRHEGTELVQSRHEVSLYSQKSDSWKSLADFPFQGSFINHIHQPNQHDAVFARNALHWVMRDVVSKAPFVAAFDLSTEQFHRVPTPPLTGYDNIETMMVSIGNLGGCLSVLCPQEQRAVDLWVMKEYGNKDSWTKFTMKLDNDFSDSPLTPLGCLKSSSTNNHFGQILLQVGKGKLMLYDFELRSFMLFSFPALLFPNAIFIRRITTSPVACVCFGSLLQPEREKQLRRKGREVARVLKLGETVHNAKIS